MEHIGNLQVGHFFKENGVLMRLTSDDLSFIYKCENPYEIYSPVLLTDKVLRHMRFHYNDQFGFDNSYYKLIFQYSKIILRYNDLTQSYYRSNNPFRPSLKYVHELQNFLDTKYNITIRKVDLFAFNQAVD